MGISHRHADNVAASLRNAFKRQEFADALAAIQDFNARLAAKKTIWAWPVVGATLLTKHHWFVCVCDACDTVVELDQRMKPRHPDASVRIALRDVRCPRCNGHGRIRPTGLSEYSMPGPR